MIEKFLTQQQTLFRMREGILGPHLAAIAKTLDEVHYSTATIRLHLRAADHFGVWCNGSRYSRMPDHTGGGVQVTLFPLLKKRLQSGP